MKRLIEKILGLDAGFLSREGELYVGFNPQWPWQDVIGAATWNILLGLAALGLVIWIYRREGRSQFARVLLGTMRAALLAFIIAMLNRPVLTLSQSRTEPSVLAVAMDDSISMRVRDAAPAADGTPRTRMEAMIELLGGNDQKLIKDLAAKHVLKFYRFDKDAQGIATVSKENLTLPKDAAPTTGPAPIGQVLASLKPDGQTTQVLGSLRTILEELQGQRLAGVVVLTDGRSTPVESLAEAFAPVKEFGIKLYPVAVGSDRPPQNVIVESINMQDAAFVRDIVNVRATVRAIGYAAGHVVTLTAKDKRSGQPLMSSAGRPVTVTVALENEAAQEVELNFKPSDVGTLDVAVEAVKQAGEVDEEDNTRFAQIQVLDAKIAVLYCDGYPRWEYRYIKNEMMRDETIDISCLLFSADTGFAQEGDKPITRFPESLTEILEYDAVVFGDVDPRQFTDFQLQLVQDFVAKKGGGFGMIAGPKFAPSMYRNTPIEPILPVSIARVQYEEVPVPVQSGFRPVLTRDGLASTIFRFFEDRARNSKFISEEIQPVFWYCKGVSAKPGVGEIYAEHPTESGPDGKKAPILVLGRFGAGRTLFSAIDDSWRWRFYTGESVFDTYWIQQLRYLARSKKLGQRRFTLTSLKPAYELGEKVEMTLRVLDPDLLSQLPDQVNVTVTTAEGQPVKQDRMQRREGQDEVYTAAWTADAVGRFVFKLPNLAGGAEAQDLPFEVSIPRLELMQPQIDRTLLTRLASETLGQAVSLEEARERLPAVITSAARIIPIESNQPLWDAPLALLIFVLLITAEWVLRKVYGML